MTTRRKIDLATVTTIIDLAALALVVFFFAIVYPPANLLVAAAVLFASSYKLTKS